MSEDELPCRGGVLICYGCADRESQIKELQARLNVAVDLISQMRGQWIDSWARDKCFEILRQNGRENEAKIRGR